MGRTRRNTDLWVACIAGAIPLDDYVGAIESAGLRVPETRENDDDFISERALEACGTNGVASVFVLAAK